MQHARSPLPSTNDKVDTLSDDVIVLIFQLTLKDLRTWAFLLRVSRRWHVCGRLPPALHFLQVIRPRLNLDAYPRLASLQGLRVLTLDHTTRDEEVKHLSKLRTLQILDMSGLTAFAGSTLASALKGMSNIKDLELGGNRNQTVESLAVIATSAPSLQALKMSQTRCDDSVLESLSALSSLRRLDAFGCQGVSDAGMLHLTCLSSLRELYIGECSVSRAGLRALSALSRLKVLNIAGSTSMNNEALEEVGKVTSLQSLSLADSTFTDAGIKHLSTLTRLTDLNLAHCTEITNAGIGMLTSLSSLAVIGLGGCLQLTDDAIESLSQLPLQHIKLARNLFYTDDALLHVSRFKKLQTLEISRISTFTSKGVAGLGLLTSLRELTLSGLANVTDEGIANCVFPLRLLEVALLGHMAVGVNSLAALASLPLLRSLDVNHCSGVNNAGLEVFARPGNLLCLSSLNLSGCDISDAGVKILVEGPGRPLDHLHRLGFADCISLTDDALRDLARIPYLQSLVLSGCIDITDTGVETLVALPSLERLQLGGCLRVSTRLQRAVGAVSATRSVLALPSSARSYPKDWPFWRPLRRLWFRTKVMLWPVPAEFRFAQLSGLVLLSLLIVFRNQSHVQRFFWSPLYRYMARQVGYYGYT